MYHLIIFNHLGVEVVNLEYRTYSEARTTAECLHQGLANKFYNVTIYDTYAKAFIYSENTY